MSRQQVYNQESIRGDDLKFMFFLMGKTNPAEIAHERILYETKPI